MKFYFKKTLILILRVLFSCFFDKKYLVGRYFDNSFVGWKWCAQSILFQKILRINHTCPWPISSSNRGDDFSNISFDINDLQNFMHFGCYFSNVGGGKIIFGSGVVIAPNCGFVTTNHNKRDVHQHTEPKDIKIGKNCWIGMNAVILPGVELAEGCIVGAGAVVTKSFLTPYTTIVGNPAKAIDVKYI